MRVLHDESGKGSTGFAACGLAGAIVFTATWIVAGLAYPAFSFVNNDTSDLGALTAAHPTPYNVGLSLSGFVTIGLAVAFGWSWVGAPSSPEQLSSRSSVWASSWTVLHGRIAP